MLIQYPDFVVAAGGGGGGFVVVSCYTDSVDWILFFYSFFIHLIGMGKSHRLRAQ